MWPEDFLNWWSWDNQNCRLVRIEHRIFVHLTSEDKTMQFDPRKLAYLVRRLWASVTLSIHILTCLSCLIEHWNECRRAPVAPKLGRIAWLESCSIRRGTCQSMQRTMFPQQGTKVFEMFWKNATEIAPSILGIQLPWIFISAKKNIQTTETSLALSLKRSSMEIPAF